MKELFYLEVPTPDTASVRHWLQREWQPRRGEKVMTPDGVRLQNASRNMTGQCSDSLNAIVIMMWSLQRTTYLKAFRWGKPARFFSSTDQKQLIAELRQQFPPQFPELPDIETARGSIFDALAPHYPQTVQFFQKIPSGEYDLNRAYWWEKRWRDNTRNPQPPQPIIRRESGAFIRDSSTSNFSDSPAAFSPHYDLIYIGGALGVLHAAVMAKLGYRVLLIERLPFGRMNREWNISRDEFQSLIDLGLFSIDEFESIIAREYVDGYSKFFDGNNPPQLKSTVLNTPTVLNIAIDSEKLLQLCGQKLHMMGGSIWDQTEFRGAEVYDDGVMVSTVHLDSHQHQVVNGRLLVDAMGTASPIAWQLNGGRAFDSVCPTVGAVIDGKDLPTNVWDNHYGDVLNSHGDISRGRQLIWELFPGEGSDLTVYLFHYHQVHPNNPGSLLEMYEDFFTILPEYRRCDLEKLTWKKATFGYIPGHFSVDSRDRSVAFDRLLAIGDAASLQSPLVFTGFGSLVRNLGRLTTLLDTALKHDLLDAEHLNLIRAYQSNISVTWLFSKGMMVPTGKALPPQRINAMLNTFFGLLADEPTEVADRFIKDRIDWLSFSLLALKAARRNPLILPWIFQMAGAKDTLRWLGSYVTFTLDALLGWFLGIWLAPVLKLTQPWMETYFPGLWFRLLGLWYSLILTQAVDASFDTFNQEPSRLPYPEAVLK